MSGDPELFLLACTTGWSGNPWMTHLELPPCSAQRDEKFGAGALTPSAGLGAQLAVAVHRGMLSAFLSTDPACCAARFEHRTGRASVNAGLAGEDPSGRRGNVNTVQVSADAIGELGDHVFVEAGIRARGTRLRAVKARLETFSELGPVDAFEVLRVGVQHGLYVGHWNLFPGLDSRG